MDRYHLRKDKGRLLPRRRSGAQSHTREERIDIIVEWAGRLNIVRSLYGMKYKSSLCACLLLLPVVAAGHQEQLPRVIPTMSRETHSKLFVISRPTSFRSLHPPATFCLLQDSVTTRCWPSLPRMTPPLNGRSDGCLTSLISNVQALPSGPALRLNMTGSGSLPALCWNRSVWGRRKRLPTSSNKC